MTLPEFKAWFSGFTESMDSTPNEKEWARVKERVGEIDGVAITRTVYIDRYVERSPYRPYWNYGVAPTILPTVWTNGGAACGQADNAALAANSHYATFNSHSAMLDLGKAEFQAVQ